MTNHVLVPLDRSEAAQQALRFALEEYPDATITALHVTNPMEDTYFGSAEDFYSQVDTLGTESATRSEAILEQAESIAAESGRTIETADALGQPAKAIIEYAHDNAVDHVVIGSHGRSGMARLVLGSVAEQVVRRCQMPVTVIKGEKV